MHGRSRAVSVLILGLVACTSTSPPPPRVVSPRDEAPIARDPEIAFVKRVLDNGLTLIMHEDHRLPLVAVSVWYDVGALHESENRSGFAHLFEHMMFQGSPHVGEDMHFKLLEEAGATHVNGTTDFDRTNYIETLPRNELELALWVESDRMGFLLSSLSQKSLDNQIAVVKNERQQSVENRPYGLLSEFVTQTLYPRPHPYHGDVIGSLEDISAATLDDVREFFRTYYSPANATITLAGDFDPTRAIALVEKYFGTLEGRAKPDRRLVDSPALESEMLVRFDEPVGRLAKLVIAWNGPHAFETDTAALDLLAHVLSGTRSARLDKRLAFDELIAQSVSARFAEHKAGGEFTIEVAVRPGRTLEEAHAAVDQVLDELRARPPTSDELRRAANARETGVFEGLEILGGFSGRAELLQLYESHFGDPGRLAWDLERFRRVTTGDLSRVLEQYLGPNRLVVYATPRGKTPEGAVTQ